VDWKKAVQSRADEGEARGEANKELLDVGRK